MKKVSLLLLLWVACASFGIAQKTIVVQQKRPQRLENLRYRKMVCRERITHLRKWSDKEYGYLATEKTFKDFELTLQFLQEADGNSGVFFHSSIEGTKISGWQAEVAPPGHSTGGIYESYGRGWLIKPAEEKDKALKMGEWNTMKIKVVGNKVTTWLNGVEMITLDDEKIGSRSGSIALQIHSGGGIRVKWRKINIVEL
jgi:hypothetical protein